MVDFAAPPPTKLLTKLPLCIHSIPHIYTHTHTHTHTYIYSLRADLARPVSSQLRHDLMHCGLIRDDTVWSGGLLPTF